MLGEAQSRCDDGLLTVEAKRITEERVREFRSKAVGSDLDEYEGLLRGEIDKKFAQILK